MLVYHPCSALPHSLAVGYCLLLAELLAAALQPLLPPSARSAASSSGSGSALPSRAQLGRAVVSALLLGSMLGFYAVRTVERNRDWWDEERLFRAAQKARQEPGRKGVGMKCCWTGTRCRASTHMRWGARQGFCPFYLCSITLVSSSLCGAQHPPAKCHLPMPCCPSGVLAQRQGAAEQRHH